MLLRMDAAAWLSAPMAPPLPSDMAGRDRFGREVLDACQQLKPPSLRRLLPFRHLAPVDERVRLVRRTQPSPMYERDTLLGWLTHELESPDDDERISHARALVDATREGVDPWATGVHELVERLLVLVRLVALAALEQEPDAKDVERLREDLAGPAHAQPELTIRAMRALPPAERDAMILACLERGQTLALHVLAATDSKACHEAGLGLALGLPKSPGHEPTLTSALIRAGEPMQPAIVATLDRADELASEAHDLVLGAATERALRTEATDASPLRWAEAALLSSGKSVRRSGLRTLCRIAPWHMDTLESLTSARKKALRDGGEFAVSILESLGPEDAEAVATSFDPARRAFSPGLIDAFVHERRSSAQLPWQLAYAIAALPLPPDFRARLVGALMHPRGASPDVLKTAKRAGSWLAPAPHGLAPRRLVEWAPKSRKRRAKKT